MTIFILSSICFLSSQIILTVLFYLSVVCVSLIYQIYYIWYILYQVSFCLQLTDIQLQLA